MTSHPTRKSIKAFLAVAKARFVPDVSGNEDAFIVAGNESAGDKSGSFVQSSYEAY